jgi:hypothetical protein
MAGGAASDLLIYDAESLPISGDTIPPDGNIDSPGFSESAETFFVNLSTATR